MWNLLQWLIKALKEASRAKKCILSPSSCQRALRQPVPRFRAVWAVHLCAELLILNPVSRASKTNKADRPHFSPAAEPLGLRSLLTLTTGLRLYHRSWSP